MVRAIILAAGFGSRLMPLTEDRPKGMVKLQGMPLLSHQISVLRAGGISDISLIGGYLSEELKTLGLPVIPNSRYDSTNMVESLMCARALFDGTEDVLMAYGDIVYEPHVLETVLNTSGSIVVTADRQWRKLWSARMEDYASDVETFRIDESGMIVELGRRPDNLDDVQAQYIGLVRFAAADHEKLLKFYDGLDRTARFDGQPFPKMYMTSFLQQLIDQCWNVRPALISNGWLEVDTLQDLQRYEQMAGEHKLDSLCRLQQPPEAFDILQSLAQKQADPVADICDIGALANQILNTGMLDPDTLKTLDYLARKIEITGILHSHYVQSNMKPANPNETASPSEAGALLACYLLAFDQTNDPRHLNTVLKALDGALHTPRPLMHHELDNCCAMRLHEND